MRKTRKPKEKTAITKEIVEDDSSGDENKKLKFKVEKVSFEEEKSKTFLSLSFKNFANLR